MAAVVKCTEACLGQALGRDCGAVEQGRHAVSNDHRAHSAPPKWVWRGGKLPILGSPAL